MKHCQSLSGWKMQQWNIVFDGQFKLKKMSWSQCDYETLTIIVRLKMLQWNMVFDGQFILRKMSWSQCDYNETYCQP